MRIPYGEGEHAAQVMHHRFAPLGIEVQQDLRVRLAAKFAALGLEAEAQMTVVVDLAVERNDRSAIAARHRLRACVGEIDDRQAPMAEAETAIVRKERAHAIG